MGTPDSGNIFDMPFHFSPLGRQKGKDQIHIVTVIAAFPETSPEIKEGNICPFCRERQKPDRETFAIDLGTAPKLRFVWPDVPVLRCECEQPFLDGRVGESLMEAVNVLNEFRRYPDSINVRRGLERFVGPLGVVQIEDFIRYGDFSS